MNMPKPPPGCPDINGSLWDSLPMWARMLAIAGAASYFGGAMIGALVVILQRVT